jgi:hypothetical protein
MAGHLLGDQTMAEIEARMENQDSQRLSVGKSP